MFNKSTLFNRNDPVSRRAYSGHAGNRGQTPPESTGGRPAASAKEVPGASAASTAPSIAAPFDATTASPPAVETKVTASAESGTETGWARTDRRPRSQAQGAEILGGRW